MGQKVRVLAQGQVKDRTIFNNRFVMEVCEKIHVHYRNLRIVMSLMDWEQMTKGAKDAYTRWKTLGEPGPGMTHIELCRKKVAMIPHSDQIMVSLNKNLYGPNEGKVFSEGAEFHETEYIHVKYRDLRLEMPIDEFKEFARVMTEASNAL